MAVLDGSIQTFLVTALELSPAPSPSVSITYTATLANGDPLPTDLITFDASSLQFRV